METINKLEVYLAGRHVGTIAPYQRYLTAFAYSDEWLQNGFSISPFSLPLTTGVKIARSDPFDGLFGIFMDSLPDGWNRLLMDRMLRKWGENPDQITPLQRLSIVGDAGMGALEYRPAGRRHDVQPVDDLDRLAEACRMILGSGKSEDLDTLFAMGGFSGGARPKVLLKLDDGEWIVKFPSSGDPDGIGRMEYEYNLCAKACGIEIPEVRLFPSSNGTGYFGCRRFDRERTDAGEYRLHLASASALLEVSHRVPSLDYSSLMALTWQLTKRAAELEKLFRLMCFNVYAHNRDDHSKNFSFLCDEGDWRLAPAYDLTYSSSIGGEHATTVAGEGRDPGLSHILQVGKKAGISETKARQIAEEVRETVTERLGAWLTRDYPARG
ncbi:MAG: type II toxin-antitoxin system HipA family toxin [Oscillospiraceae bacterium]|nr:type II toxin-antitoxin system HipA family toxin [Oscillospiraceae bacterium]